MDPFLEACGATGPIRLEVKVPGSSQIERFCVNQPFLLIGRHPRADITLAHDEVSVRHAYLQVVQGRLFCVDLESQAGIRLGQGRTCPSWIGPSEAIRIGPYQIRARVGDSNIAARTNVLNNDLSPLTSSYGTQHQLIRATLEILSGQEESGSYALSHAVTFVGGSRLCKIRVRDPAASAFYGAFVRTPIAIWFVDLQSGDGVRVNGQATHHVRLTDGDVIQIGRYSLRVQYESLGGRGLRSEGSGLALPEVSVVSGAMPVAVPQWGSDTSSGIQPILHQVAQMQQHMGSQFQQTLMMITQLFGTMHRDHMEAVQAELEQLRQLNQQVQDLKGSLPHNPSTTPTTDTPGSTPVPDGPLPGHGADEDEPQPRLNPQEIHALVGEQLAAFERERQTYWNKILKIMTKD